jgi:hypothetical protein
MPKYVNSSWVNVDHRLPKENENTVLWVDDLPWPMCKVFGRLWRGFWIGKDDGKVIEGRVTHWLEHESRELSDGLA